MNRPSPRLAILRAQLAAEADAIRIQRASYKISNAVGCSCPVPAPDADSLPLPPDYWSDLEHWLKTLAPAKPAAPTQQPAQKASTHSVCIRAHKSLGFNRDIGTVLPMLPHHRSRPEYWLSCDESGWVTHVPTADSVCPVPEGLDFAAMWNDGEVSGLVSRYFREHVNTWRSNHMSAGLRAWRPIAQS